MCSAIHWTEIGATTNEASSSTSSTAAAAAAAATKLPPLTNKSNTSHQASHPAVHLRQPARGAEGVLLPLHHPVDADALRLPRHQVHLHLVEHVGQRRALDLQRYADKRVAPDDVVLTFRFQGQQQGRGGAEERRQCGIISTPRRLGRQRVQLQKTTAARNSSTGGAAVVTSAAAHEQTISLQIASK